jgi:hypothetical protein
MAVALLYSPLKVLTLRAVAHAILVFIMTVYNRLQMSWWTLVQ